MEDQSCKSMLMNKEEETIDLPPGFRFHPTDEEIITYYLTPKVMNSSFAAIAVAEIDLNKCEPWDLPKKEVEKETYFFCQRDRKYPTGTRTNRATESGYWKATGKDKEIFRGKRRRLVGMKKTLVFYRGRAPKGEKTNWVIHEFRLEGQFSYCALPKQSKEEWVVCRVFHKSNGIKKDPLIIQEDHENRISMRINSFMDDLFHYSSYSPPPLVDPIRPSSSFSCPENYQTGFDEEDDEVLNIFPISTISEDHYIGFDQKPLIYNHTVNPNPNPNPNPVRVEGELKLEQFWSNQDSINMYINNIAEVSSSKLRDNPNDIDNLGLSRDRIPDMADMDCLWDF